MVGAARPTPGRWAAAGYTSLMVALFVAEPAHRAAVTSAAGPRSAAVHIGADDLRHSRHAAWARPLSCRDTVERLSRLCQAAGVRTQQALLGPDTTTRRVRSAIAGAAATIGPGGLPVLTFSGHSERPVPGEHDGGWCLHDAALRHAETATLLAAAPASARIAENQATLNYQHSEFVHKLERLTYPGGRLNPDCRSYAWLRRELRQDTPDVERPDIRASNPAAMRQRPFRPAPRR